MLKKELNIFTFGDLLEHFPFRHIDKTSVTSIANINPTTDDYVQVIGTIINLQSVGEKAGKRLVAHVKDETGILELAWFQGITWVQKQIEVGTKYLLFGKPTMFNNKVQIVHPELEVFTQELISGKSYLEPIYPTTEKLKARGLSAKQIAKLTLILIGQIKETDILENIPSNLLTLNIKFI